MQMLKTAVLSQPTRFYLDTKLNPNKTPTTKEIPIHTEENSSSVWKIKFKKSEIPAPINMQIMIGPKNLMLGPI
jgi:hypothetical protein